MTSSIQYVIISSFFCNSIRGTVDNARHEKGVLFLELHVPFGEILVHWYIRFIRWKRHRLFAGVLVLDRYLGTVDGLGLVVIVEHELVHIQGVSLRVLLYVFPEVRNRQVLRRLWNEVLFYLHRGGLVHWVGLALDIDVVVDLLCVENVEVVYFALHERQVVDHSFELILFQAVQDLLEAVLLLQEQQLPLHKRQQVDHFLPDIVDFVVVVIVEETHALIVHPGRNELLALEHKFDEIEPLPIGGLEGFVVFF